MAFLDRLLGRKQKRPFLEVMGRLSAAIVESSIQHCKHCAATLRAGSNVIEPGTTQFVLDEFVFLQLHLVEKAACLMLTRRTQDLFLPAFVPSTLWRHMKTQAPEWAEDQVKSQSDSLLPTFDAANAEYWGASTATPPTVGNVDEQLSSLFAKRVLRAAQTPLSSENLIVVMRSMSGLINSISVATHLSELLQIPDDPVSSA